jgi:hypothetical protein
VSEPETCKVCGSTDVVAGECKACAELLEEEDALEAPDESEVPDDEPDDEPDDGS